MYSGCERTKRKFIPFQYFVYSTRTFSLLFLFILYLQRHTYVIVSPIFTYLFGKSVVMFILRGNVVFQIGKLFSD